MVYEVEARSHRDIHRLLTAVKQLLHVQLKSFKDRMVGMTLSSSWQIWLFLHREKTFCYLYSSHFLAPLCMQIVTWPEIMVVYAFFCYFLYRLETGCIMWWGMAGGHPHRFPHNNFSSVCQIFTKLSHMIPLWKGKNPIYFWVIRSKVKVNVTINRIFDNRVVSAR